MEISTYLTKIALIVNGLNAPFKGHWVTEWIKIQIPYVSYLEDIYSDLRAHTD